MADELGEFVGKGFAILKRRIAAVEGRKALDGIDGQDGKDGTDGLKGDIGPDGPQGETGDVGLDGKDGIEGVAGKDGADGATGHDGRDGINGTNGTDGDNGQDGTDGKEGKRGPDGLDGRDGKDGKDGDDGEGVSDAKIDKRGHLIITLDDGTKIDAGKAKGKDAQQFQGMIASGPSAASTSEGGISETFMVNSATRLIQTQRIIAEIKMREFSA